MPLPEAAGAQYGQNRTRKRDEHVRKPLSRPFSCLIWYFHLFRRRAGKAAETENPTCKLNARSEVSSAVRFRTASWLYGSVCLHMCVLTAWSQIRCLACVQRPVRTWHGTFQRAQQALRTRQPHNCLRGTPQDAHLLRTSHLVAGRVRVSPLFTAILIACAQLPS